MGLLDRELHPYVVFLPSDEKVRMLGAIFGSRAAVDILKLALSQGVSKKIYQKDVIEKLSYSNKTVIGNLKSLTRLGVLMEDMEKAAKQGRTVWVKTYLLSDVGKWFALLLADEKDLSQKEKAEILQSLFRAYIKWVKDLSAKLNVDQSILREVFKDELK